MENHSNSVGTYGLKKIPSKSCLHDMTKRFAQRMDEIMDILLAQAKSDARGTLAGDSTGFSIMKYEEWEDAKKGFVSRREFNKLHILMAPHGMIVTCEVTGGRVHDSPIFRDMMRRIPDGNGYVLLDAAYLSKKNCKIIAEKRRRSVICPKENSRSKGFNEMAEMLRWHRDDPAGFDKEYHQRSLVENTFSVMKERFGSVVRAKKASMRKLHLMLRCICYNLIA